MRKFLCLLCISVLISIAIVYGIGVRKETIAVIPSPLVVAEEITVRVEGASNGSGAIIDRYGDVYYVLSNAHVFKNPGSYMTIAPDGNRYPIDNGTIVKLPGIDLAIFAFTSPLSYSVATLADTEVIRVGDQVYVAGWPRSGNMLRQRMFMSTEGKITETNSQLADGYSLTYTNLVRVGMSGGPIVNEFGRLIGIHGIARLLDRSNRIVASGIGINRFLQWRSSHSLPRIQPDPRSRLDRVKSNTAEVDRQVITNQVARSESNFRFDGIKSFSVGENALTSIAVSQIGSLNNAIVATSSHDGSISLWNLFTNRLIKSWQGHTEAINKIIISPDGQILVSASHDRSIKIWNLETGELLHNLTGHRDAVSSLAFTPDGKRIVSGSWDQTIKIWNAQTGELIHTLTGHDRLISSIALSPNGQILASGSQDGSIRLWSLSNYRLMKIIPSSPLGVLSVIFTSDSEHLISGSTNGKIGVWNCQTGSKLKTLSSHQDGVWSLAIAADNRTLVSGSWDRTIKLWDLATGQLKNTLNGHADYVIAVALSLDDRFLVSAGWNGEIEIWRRL